MKIRVLHICLLLATLIVFSFQSEAQCGGFNANISADQSFICMNPPGPYIVSLTNSSTGTSASTGFDWYVNGSQFNNTNDVATAVNYSFPSSGVYTFMMIADDPADGCVDTAYVQVIVAPVPTASFNFTPNDQCAGQEVSFTNTSTGTFSETQYDWDFGPGPNSSQEDPDHTFNSAGSYNVTLTVDNGTGCQSSITQVVDVIDSPNAVIAGDDGDGDLTYCLFPGDNTSTETVTFSNFTTNATSYEWDFGDGSPLFTTSSLADITHDYVSYGTFTVTMTATHSNGCQSVTTLDVVFEKFVSASLSLDLTEYSGCAPHELTTLNNLAVNATTFVWDFGDGSTFTLNDPIPPAYAYQTAGTYTISLTASNSCNTANATISPIIIIDGPTANFSPSIFNGCAPQDVSFTNASSNVQPANNYQWNMGNGNSYTSVITPIIQTFPTQGSYDIELVAGNACGYDTMVQTIIIDTIPTVDLVLDPISGCAPLVVDPTATLLSGNNVTWQWLVDNAYYSNTPFDIPDQTFLSLNPNDSTLHTIQVTVTNNCGSDTEKDSVYVQPPVIALFTAPDTLCLGDVANFTNSSTGTELTYEWDFGDGSSVVNDTNTSYTYASAGNYNVTLTTTGLCGIDTYVLPVVIIDIPIADITVDPPLICSGEEVSFTNNSTTNGTYSWSFGAGASPTTSTSFDPGVVSYSGTGTSEIIFTINYGGCVDADTITVDVAPIPVASFTVDPISGCTPVDVTVTNTSVDEPGNNYEWDYGNGASSTGYVANNQVYLAGLADTSYTITLVVSSGNSCSDTVTNSILVSPLPTAAFSVVDDTVCLGEPISFLNESIGASSYSWTFGDGGTSSNASPTYTYTSDGVYSIQLVALTGAGCSNTITGQVVVDSIPMPSFTNTIECLGGTTLFTNTSSGTPTAYEWDFGDGSPIDNSTDPSHDYLAAGSYNVTLTVVNGVSCTNSITQPVLVNQVPVADFNWSQTCLGNAMSFTDNSLNTPITWDWDFGDGNTDNVQNPNHLYADTGSYLVQLVVSGGSGCLDSIEMTVYVDSVPTPDFTFLSVCAEDTTNFINLSSISPDQYLWDFGDGNSSTLTDPSHIYLTNGIYPVSLTATYSSNGCSATIIQDVESYTRTFPSFTANTPCLGDTTDLIDQTIGGPIQWQWDFGDGSGTSFDQNPSHLFGGSGFYNIALITENMYGCSDTLFQQIEIYGLPTAEFSFDTVCQGANTQFVDLSVDDAAWNWDFGDLIGTSNSENPIYVFNDFGQFTVELITFNSVGCSDTITHDITVYPNPTSNFTVDTACFGYNTSFTDLSIDAIDWFYDLGDGSSSINPNPVHLYPLDGTYTVQQLVTNIYGCQDSSQLIVVVDPQPQSGFYNTIVCARDSVQFSDTTIGNNIVTWNWDFGDGVGNSNLQNPSYVFDPGGIYDVTLITGNSSGCLDTIVIPVEVYTNPTPNFSVDTVCYLEISTFNDLSVDSAQIVSWFWDFGDNINVSSQQNPTYIYQQPGVYPVTLSVINEFGCDSTITLDAIVNNIPVADFYYDTVCWGSPTTFTDNSNGSVNSWSWNFGDGNISNVGPVVQNTYDQPGSYIVSMVADGGVGCTDEEFHIVTVSEVVSPVIGVQDTVCESAVIQFQDLSQTMPGTVVNGWLWDFGDGATSDLQNPQHAYSQAGIYTVTLEVFTNTECSNIGTIDINVFAPPVANFTSTIPCEGQETQFTDLSFDNGAFVNFWHWNFGDNSAVSFDQMPNHLYGSAGDYQVELIVGSTIGCYDTIVQTTTIYPSPVASFISGLECGGEPTDLISTSTGNINDYSWIYQGNTIGSDSTISYVYPTDTDVHPTTLIVTTDLGCIDSITQNVISRPVVFFDYGPLQTSGCPVMEVDFVDNTTASSGSTVINWLWNMGDGTYSFAQNPTHFYEDPGTYNISLQVTTSDDCIYTDTLAYTVIVYPQPIAGFDYSPDSISIARPEVFFDNLSEGAIDAEWYFGDFDYSNDWEPDHTYLDTGYYEVTQYVYNEYGCSDTASQWLYVEGVFVVYAPNAFTPDGNEHNHYFNIKGYGFESYELLIYDRWGNKVATITEDDIGWDGTYNGNSCQDGVYVWKLRAIDDHRIPHEMTGHVSLLR